MPADGMSVTRHAEASPAPNATPSVASNTGVRTAAENSTDTSVTRPLTAGGRSVVPVESGSGVLALPPGQPSGSASLTTGGFATVEELLEEGLYGAGASPVHLAIRGTPTAGSVRCAWSGIARTAQQREDAIRFWLQLDPADAIPAVAILEQLFSAVMDTVFPIYRETATANFLAIARGGESMDYLFLTCFADYAVTNFLLGTGTTPTAVTGDGKKE